MTFAGTKVYDADEYSPYKYIVTQDRNGYFKRIPLPDAQSATVSLNILDKLESVEVNVVGDPYGSNLYLAIKDFTLTTDAENFIQERELPDEGERETTAQFTLRRAAQSTLPTFCPAFWTLTTLTSSSV